MGFKMKRRGPCSSGLIPCVGTGICSSEGGGDALESNECQELNFLIHDAHSYCLPSIRIVSPATHLSHCLRNCVTFPPFSFVVVVVTGI